MTIKIKIEQLILRLILLSGIILSVYQFFFNRSLWVDEANLALNIIHRSAFELLKPLDSIQVAPVLFLLMEKLFSLLIPDSEMGLRLFPLLCYLVGLWFMYAILQKLFKDYPTLIFVLALFVFNTLMIRYSNEVKQYMCDVMLTAVFGYLLVSFHDNEKKKFIWLALAGAMGVFVSNITPILMATAGLYLLNSHFFVRKLNFPDFIKLSLVWAFAFGVYYLLFIYDHPSRDIQVKAFDNRDGFFDPNLLSPEFYRSVKLIFDNYFVELLPFGKAGTFVLSILYGFGLLTLIIKKRAGLLILTVSPIILHLILSSLKMYPVFPRLMLYHTPLLIVVIACGAKQLLGFASKMFKSKLIHKAGLLLPILVAIQFSVNGYPYVNQEIRNSIDFIQENISEGEAVYVDWRARRQYQYYVDINYVKFDAPIVTGRRYKVFSEENINELKSLSGKYWVLFAGGNHGLQWKMIKGLEQSGVKIEKRFITSKSHAYLIDFAD
jgi:hypothetical protein